MSDPRPDPTAISDPPSVELPLADELPAAPRPTTSPAPAKAHHAHVSPFRILANIAVGFVSLFLLIRTLGVEPFGVPTGSMAPALIGNHREAPCPCCGSSVRVGTPRAGMDVARHFSEVMCPNCGREFSMTAARDLNGDRLLVDKNVFNVRSPRRWEMAVFRCPDPDPKEFGKPYVKRVIGLPGEKLRILDGEVFANGELLRKGLPELRETRVPLFDLNFVPEPGGWNQRFLVEPMESDPRLPVASQQKAEPASPAVVSGNTLTLDASENPQATVGITYRNWRWDVGRAEPLRAWSSYDALSDIPRDTNGRLDFSVLPAAHDFSMECDVEVATAAEGSLFAVRLFDGADSVHAEIPVGARGSGQVSLVRDRHGALGSAGGMSLEPGRTYHIEFSLVDRRAILAIDGKIVVEPADLPQLAERGKVTAPLQLGARGCKLIIRNLKLFRDTYYTQYGEHGTLKEVTLGANDYFMLGDNSGNSQDSRKWQRPGVPETDFIGKPFLIHQPLRSARVSVGGQERVFQTVDWSRLRWLH